MSGTLRRGAVKTPLHFAGGPLAQQNIKVHTDLVGTWSQTTTVITISIASHGMVVGEKIAFYPTAGTGTLATAGIYTIATTPTAGTLTVTSATSATGTGTMLGTAAQTVYSLPIPAGTLGPNDSLECTALWSCTNSVDAKATLFKIGSTQFGGAIDVASVDGGEFKRTLRSRNSVAKQVVAAGVTGYIGTVATAHTFDFATALVLNITGQKATGTESLVLESVSVNVIRAA